LQLPTLLASVGDPDPQDPHVFGPPGSFSQRGTDPDLATDPSLFLINVLSGLK
jgi:hypothetical protein